MDPKDPASNDPPPDGTPEASEPPKRRRARPGGLADAARRLIAPPDPAKPRKHRAPKAAEPAAEPPPPRAEHPAVPLAGADFDARLRALAPQAPAAQDAAEEPAHRAAAPAPATAPPAKPPARRAAHPPPRGAAPRHGDPGAPLHAPTMKLIAEVVHRFDSDLPAPPRPRMAAATAPAPPLPAQVATPPAPPAAAQPPAPVAEAADEDDAKPAGLAARIALMADPEARETLRALRRQERARLDKQREEAEDLKRRLKELNRRVKDEERHRLDAARHAALVRAHVGAAVPAGRAVTEVPAIEEPDVAEVERFTIQEGRSYVRILYNAATHQHLYEVIEPRLSPEEQHVRAFLRDTLVRTLAAEAPEGQAPEAYLRDAIAKAIVEHAVLIDEVSREKITYYLVRDFLGFGPVDVLIRDPLIEDISCDGPGIPIYLFHRQFESIKTNVVFPTDLDLDSFVMGLAQRCGKHISIAEPLLDATLPDKSRLQASLSREVTTSGSTFTVRKFRADPLTPPDLVRLGAMSPRVAAYFWIAVEQGSSVIYAGGTASGKTTTLNAVCQFIPPQKKVVSIEDTREINLVHENWIPGLTRTGFGDQVVNGKLTGTIDMYRLLEEALRQRPEYLLVGEVRGPEALTLFQAMATGHATYSTLHADSAESAMLRLENPPINVPRVMLQTLDCIAIQTQVRVGGKLVRRVKEVVELDGVDPQTGEVRLKPVFRWDRRHDRHDYLGASRILERAMEHDNMSAAEIEEDWRDRTRILEWMGQKGIRRIRDVASVITQFYSDPDALLQQVSKEWKPPPEAAAHGA